MDKRNRVLAILGAGVLTLGVVGVALAEDLLPGQVGMTVGEKYNADVCADFPLAVGEGQVGLHFILTDPESDEGLLDATFSNPAGSLSGVADADKNSDSMHFYAVIDGSADTVLVSAHTDIDGGNLVLSHACPNGTETTTTTTEETTTTTEETTTTTEETTTTTTEETTTTTSEETTTTTSFSQSVGAETDTPSEPDTATFGPSDVTGAPGNGAWLLVLALGALIASLVVFTPARARTRR
jgi:hypothetical protein